VDVHTHPFSLPDEFVPLLVLLPDSQKPSGKPGKTNGAHANKNGKTPGMRVMLFGRLRELALYRAEVLRMSGFTTIIPETKEEAADILKRCALDVAVFSYTLPSAVVEELSDLLRDYCPDIPLVSISDKRWNDRRISPTELVVADDGPAALIAALRRVTEKG
jgi:hypothetical protein